MPEGSEEGIVRGLYRLGRRDAGELRVQLIGSGPILREVQRAAEILAARYDISSTIWSATSFGQLRRDALEVQRWNMLHPGADQRRSYIQTLLEGVEGPFIAASDYMRAVSDQVDDFVPGGIFSLGTDGFGRSDTREALRRHFEVDAECIALAAIYRLSQLGKLDAAKVQQAISELEIDPEKVNPMTA